MTRTGNIRPSWTGPGAVRRRTSAARTGSWSFWRRSSDPAHEQHRDMVRWYGGPFDPDRLGRGAGAVRHGEHGAPAARSIGQPQDWITATETLTAVVSNGSGIGGGVFGVKPPSNADGTQGSTGI